MKIIIAEIVALKERDYGDVFACCEVEENIVELGKKIGLLEKMLAANFAESEVIFRVILRF